MTRTDWNDYDWQLIHEGPQEPSLHMALDAVITCLLYTSPSPRDS